MKVQGSVDRILRIILSVILITIPIALTAVVWFTPALELNKFLVGLTTVNGILGTAEAIFLIRAAIFPDNGRLWWLEDQIKWPND